MSTAATVRETNQKLAKALSSLKTEHAGMLARIEDLNRSIADLEQTPVPPDEIVARAREHVAATAVYAVEEHGRTTLDLIGNPAARPGVLNLLPNWRRDWWLLLCIGAPEVATNILVELVRCTPHEAGVPMAERPALLADLREQLRCAETDEETFVDEAIRAGVVLEHRPDVVERRQSEARRAELEEQAIADRAARQHQIDAAFLQRQTESQGRSAGESEYLQSRRIR